MNSLKEQEYLSLREEIQTNLKTQQSWSTFSIGAVLTFVGVALKWETPEIYLLPIVLLLLISLKKAKLSPIHNEHFCVYDCQR